MTMTDCFGLAEAISLFYYRISCCGAYEDENYTEPPFERYGENGK